MHASCSTGAAEAARLLSKLIPADDAALVRLQPAAAADSPSCVARAGIERAAREPKGLIERSAPRCRRAAHRQLQHDGHEDN